MAGADALDRLDPVLRQPRPRDAGVVLALDVLDEAGLLEPVQQPRHAGRRQHQQLDEVDAAEAVLIRPGEVVERLEVVDRQPARTQHLGLELPAQHRVRPHQAGECGQLDRLFNCLRAQYLTTQGFSSILVAYSRIHDETRESNEHYSRTDHEHSDRHLGPRPRPLRRRLRSHVQRRGHVPRRLQGVRRQARRRQARGQRQGRERHGRRPAARRPPPVARLLRRRAVPRAPLRRRRRSSATATRSRSTARSRFAA